MPGLSFVPCIGFDLGFIIALDIKAVSFLQIMSIFVQNAFNKSLLPFGQLPGGGGQLGI